MDPLIIERVVYHFQDLVSQKKVKTFTKFLAGIKTYYEPPCVGHISRKFIYSRLKSMHAFLKVIQSHPNNHLLSHALKPLFEYLLHGVVVPRVVYVLDKKYEGHPASILFIKYSDLIIAAQKKSLIQMDNNAFVIPFKGAHVYIQPEHLGVFEGAARMRNSWVTKYIEGQTSKKMSASLEVYGEEILSSWLGSKEDMWEMAGRVAFDYLNSDSEYLSLEIFDMKKQPIFKEFDKIITKYDSWMRLRDKLCFRI